MIEQILLAEVRTASAMYILNVNTFFKKVNL